MTAKGVLFMEKNLAKDLQQNEKIWTRDFIFIWLANFFVFTSFQMTLPTIPLFVKELGGTDQLIGVVVGVFTFSALIFRPFAGHALETRGRKTVYLIGLILFFISVSSFGFITSLLVLIGVRIVQGIGWGLSTTASGTIATDLIPPKRRGEGMGYFGLSSNIAISFGPALGLVLVDYMSFKNLFLSITLFGIIALLLSANIRYKKIVQLEERTATLKFDVLEKTALHPSALLFFITLTFGGMAAFLPLYTLEKNISGIQFYFVFYAIFLMLSRIMAGKWYDKKGHFFVVPPGTVLIIVAMLLQVWLPNTFVLLLAGSIYGFGFGMVQPALQAWAVDKAAENRKAMANATFFSSFDLGVGLGAVIFGQIAYLYNYQVIYMISACSVFISLIYYFILYFYQRNKRNR